MNFQIDEWMKLLTCRLIDVFGKRLLAVGLQGSFKRGEARAGSDIDAVVVLDKLLPADLDTYKKMLAELRPQEHPVCGFISGKEELGAWPRSELFQFVRDTRAVYGSLGGILPELTKDDARSAANAGAGSIYHALCHTWVHGTVSEAFLAELYKSAFFVLQALYFWRSGRYAASKAELAAAATGEDRRIAEGTLDAQFRSPAELLAWASCVLAETSPSACSV